MAEFGSLGQQVEQQHQRRVTHGGGSGLAIIGGAMVESARGARQNAEGTWGGEDGRQEGEKEGGVGGGEKDEAREQNRELRDALQWRRFVKGR